MVRARRADRDIRPYEVRGEEYDRVVVREAAPTEGRGSPCFFIGKKL